MEIRIIEDTSILEDIFRKEFDSIPPTGTQGLVFGLYEGNELKAFVLAEQLLRIGLIWVNPEDRERKKGVGYLRRLFNYLWNAVPENNSVIGIDCDGKYYKVLERFGYRKLKGTVYRLDR